MKAVAAHAGCKILRVTTPRPHKDANDWTRAGATKDDIETAIRNAKLVDIPKSASEWTPQTAEIETQTPDAADIRGQIVAILADANLTSRQQRKAIGRESQAVGALQTAEADKSLFCLQNDTLGAALLAHVTEETTLEGDAGELRTAWAANDSAIAEWSNKSFGRRLSALWPHVAATFDAKRSEGRCGWKFRIAKRSNAGLRV